MRAIRAIVSMSIAVLALMLVVGTSGAAAATRCATGSDGQRWCNAPSDDYPKTVGWYGYVGVGGGPCNANPRGTVHEPGVMGICSIPAPELVWKWSGAGWSRASLADGTRAYVHPYSTGWRWIYVQGSWYAISSRRLTLEWRA